MRVFIDSEEVENDLLFLTNHLDQSVILQPQWELMYLNSRGEKKCKWFPGRFPKKISQIVLNPAFLLYLGWTGRLYQERDSYEKINYETSYQQAWIGIDLDEIPLKLVEPLYKLHLPCSIRCSKSGVDLDEKTVGLHLLFKVNQETGGYKVGERSNEDIKNTLRPFVTLLEGIGIKTCQANFRPFHLWVHGGGNRWFKKTDETIKMDRSGISSTTGMGQATGSNEVDTSKWNQLGRDFMKLMRSEGILNSDPIQSDRIQIYVKRMYDTMVGSGDSRFFFKTKSPMRTNQTYHNNGFLSLTATTISLFTNADNQIVWVRDVGYKGGE